MIIVVIVMPSVQFVKKYDGNIYIMFNYDMCCISVTCDETTFTVMLESTVFFVLKISEPKSLSLLDCVTPSHLFHC